jgi:hypothetical protein
MKTLNILQIFILILALNALNQVTDAQIVYTDVQPDISLNWSKNDGCGIKTYSLDLNNDGSPDFNISAGSDCPICQGYSRFVSVTPINGNGVAYSALGTAFASGENIYSMLSWTTSTTKIRWVYHLYNCAYGSGGSGSVGNWATVSDKYLGLKLISSSQTYYGWARLSVSVSSNSASFKVKDYAFDSTPNHSILTGATSGARFAEENTLNETNLSLNVFPNPVSNSTTISFSLEQTEDVSVRIFDETGRLVATLANKLFEEGENNITWDVREMNAGVYFLKMETGNYTVTEKISVVK